MTGYCEAVQAGYLCQGHYDFTSSTEHFHDEE